MFLFFTDFYFTFFISTGIAPISWQVVMKLKWQIDHDEKVLIIDYWLIYIVKNERYPALIVTVNLVGGHYE